MDIDPCTKTLSLGVENLQAIIPFADLSWGMIEEVFKKKIYILCVLHYQLYDWNLWWVNKILSESLDNQSFIESALHYQTMKIMKFLI